MLGVPRVDEDDLEASLVQSYGDLAPLGTGDWWRLLHNHPRAGGPPAGGETPDEFLRNTEDVSAKDPR
jgi:hypothetical protein